MKENWKICTQVKTEEGGFLPYYLSLSQWHLTYNSDRPLLVVILDCTCSGFIPSDLENYLINAVPWVSWRKAPSANYLSGAHCGHLNRLNMHLIWINYAIMLSTIIHTQPSM